MIIAIDGPAGSGKGTVAKLLAKKLNFTHLDSGSFYRVVAFCVYDAQVDPADPARVTALLPRLKIELRDTARGQRVICGGRDLTDEIRFDLVSQIVPQISRIPRVRQWANAYIRRMAEGHDVVVEGRDMTTEVFPRAELKLFLDATLEERARRRYLELKKKEGNATLAGIKESIARRDHLDRARPRGALRIAPDAIYIDSTRLGPGAVVDFIIDKANRLNPGVKANKKP